MKHCLLGLFIVHFSSFLVGGRWLHTCEDDFRPSSLSEQPETFPRLSLPLLPRLCTRNVQPARTLGDKRL